MPKLWAGRGVGRRGAATLMSPRWLRVLPSVLAAWSARLPVGFGLTGSGGRPGTRNSGSDRNTAAGPCGGAAPGAIRVAPPPLSLSVEPPVESVTSASAESGKHGRSCARAARKRVVRLPHAPITSADVQSPNRWAPQRCGQGTLGTLVWSTAFVWNLPSLLIKRIGTVSQSSLYECALHHQARSRQPPTMFLG
jgi:hypothetical protein